MREIKKIVKYILLHTIYKIKYIKTKNNIDNIKKEC